VTCNDAPQITNYNCRKGTTYRVFTRCLLVILGRPPLRDELRLFLAARVDVALEAP
jgi:hypothetical protein